MIHGALIKHVYIAPDAEIKTGKKSPRQLTEKNLQIDDNNVHIRYASPKRPIVGGAENRRLVPSTKGTASAVVKLRQSKRLVSSVVGKGVSGVPSASKAPVLL